VTPARAVSPGDPAHSEVPTTVRLVGDPTTVGSPTCPTLTPRSGQAPSTATTAGEAPAASLRLAGLDVDLDQVTEEVLVHVAVRQRGVSRRRRW
jgi:hypothetical protein